MSRLRFSQSIELDVLQAGDELDLSREVFIAGEEVSDATIVDEEPDCLDVELSNGSFIQGIPKAAVVVS
jgi:hypothetical protein